MSEKRVAEWVKHRDGSLSLRDLNTRKVIGTVKLLSLREVHKDDPTTLNKLESLHSDVTTQHWWAGGPTGMWRHSSKGEAMRGLLEATETELGLRKR